MPYDNKKETNDEKKTKLSLADRIRAKNAATKDDAASDDEKTTPLADKIKTMRKESKKTSLADRLQAKSDKLKTAMADESDESEQDSALSEEEAAALQSRIDSLETTYHDLLKRVEMTDLIQETTSLGNAIESLPDEVANVRQRGYVFKNYLEGKTEVLAEQWDDINERIEQWVEDESESLDDDLAKAQAYTQVFAQEPLSKAHQKAADKLEPLLETTETKVEAAEERIRALYEEVQNEVRQTESDLRQIVNYLDLADEATFDLDSNEAIYMIAKAEWKDNDDDPNGYLYLTDERLIFEQKETVGKTLGMFGGDDVHEVLWEAPLDALEEATNEDKGLFGGEDLVHLQFGQGAPYAEMTVEVKGGVDSSVWSTQIQRAASGKIRAESTVEPDPELIERLRSAPTACPTCGATLPKIDEGDTDVTCKYCGTVVRI